MSAIVRPVLLWLSVLPCLALLIAQVGAYLEFAMVPEPTASTAGPQNTADLVFGLMAIGGGVLGFLFTVAAGVVGLIVAATERRNSWVVAICVSGALAVAALAFYLRLRQTGSHSAVGSPT
jgi:hypothetical protein